MLRWFNQASVCCWPFKRPISPGHSGSQATLARCTWAVRKNLSASVNELSDERLSGFSNISTTLRRASSFNPSSPGGEIISRCGDPPPPPVPRPVLGSSQVMQYLGRISLVTLFTKRMSSPLNSSFTWKFCKLINLRIQTSQGVFSSRRLAFFISHKESPPSIYTELMAWWQSAG